MARVTNDGEPTYGKPTDGNVNDHEKVPPGRLPQHHFPDTDADQLSPAGDEPPLSRTRLSGDGSHTVEETLSSASSPISAD